MSSSFNPYQQWLDIPLEEQPPDCYRLLGVARFESDAAVIQLAAEKRMAHIRAFQTGPRAAYTQQLLNELASAKLRLLNPASKLQYDTALAAAISLADSEFTPDLLPPQMDESAGAPIGDAAAGQLEIRVRTRSRAPSPSRHRDQRPVGWRLPLAAVLAALIAGPCGWLVVRPRSSAPAAAPAVTVDTPAAVDPAPQPEPDTPVVVQQEANGDLNLSCTLARASGRVELRAGASGYVLAGWSPDSEDDAAEWRFKVVSLPSQAMFRVRVVYEAARADEGSRYHFVLDDAPRAREIVARDPVEEDEFFVAVPRTGEHVLRVRVTGDADQFAIRSITLSPQRP